MRDGLGTAVRPDSLQALPALKTRSRAIQTKIYFLLLSALRPASASPSDMKAFDLPRFNYVLAVIKLPFCQARAISQSSHHPPQKKKRLVIIIIAPRAARSRTELRNELINHGDINAAIKISVATYRVLKVC